MGIEFNPNVRANGLQGKQVYKAEDAATLERPMFNFRTQKTELVPELKPISVKRIELDTEGKMYAITSSMPEPEIDRQEGVAERANLKQFRDNMAMGCGIPDISKYVSEETEMHFKTMMPDFMHFTKHIVNNMA